ncbi:MAG: glutamate-5-semialdehyde dehydrogenase [Phycisphaerales bacterium]|jgi:glutamate-5-semialdehyde dehydrogenase|nr:glutamate-5-semialdehyde dehydrogenase [Phycisphaeraceae bacterium]
MSTIVERCAAARIASRQIATLSTEVKNAVLRDLAADLLRSAPAVLAANAADMAAARSAGLAEAKLARLALTDRSIAQSAEGLSQVAALPDPVGQVVRESVAASGLRVRRVRTPLGVICMIYEARPGVTIDAFALCFKAGNACILKGGKEAERSNAALAEIVGRTLRAHGIGEHALVSLSVLAREDLSTLLQQDSSIDLVIPRGGADLIRFVAQNSRIPTIQHYHGVNHIFVDAQADLDLAAKVCVSAKVSAPATCNAVECILVDSAVAHRFVPDLVRAYADAGVEIRGDEEVVLLSGSLARRASPADFGTEFLEKIVAMRIVSGLDEAIAHIHRHGSLHTEAIITRDQPTARAFCSRVAASCVLVNASTRMNDGFALGLGAEIGISTSRIHAFGPMGLEELTVTRFICEGDGQIR